MLYLFGCRAKDIPCEHEYHDYDVILMLDATIPMEVGKGTFIATYMDFALLQWFGDWESLHMFKETIADLVGAAETDLDLFVGYKVEGLDKVLYSRLIWEGNIWSGWLDHMPDEAIALEF